MKKLKYRDETWYIDHESTEFYYLVKKKGDPTRLAVKKDKI